MWIEWNWPSTKENGIGQSQRSMEWANQRGAEHVLREGHSLSRSLTPAIDTFTTAGLAVNTMLLMPGCTVRLTSVHFANGAEYFYDSSLS